TIMIGNQVETENAINNFLRSTTVKSLSLATSLTVAILGMGFNKAVEAMTFNLTPLDFGDGFKASGTITTDGTIGALTGDNLASWNVNVTDGIDGSGFTFTETNSDANPFQAVSTDGNQLNVAFPNGILQFESLAGGDFPNYFITLARSNRGANLAGYGNGIDRFRKTISLSTDSSTYVAGVIAPDATEVPEPITILGSLTALGFGAVLKRQKSKNN
ncbi:MAG: PEP-CTERM sorting domain-containing protein, partial [Microcoleaceae cyanobacterium]